MSDDPVHNHPDMAWDMDDDGDCPNCGGEGVIYCCMDEIGCIDPEGGCDLCERRCVWCNPKKPLPPPPNSKE